MKRALVALGAVVCLSTGFTASAEDGGADSDEALIQAAEKLIQEGAAPAAEAPVAPVVAAAAKPESEIPIVMSAPVEAKKAAFPWGRIAVSLGVVLLAASAGLYATKKWRRGADRGGNKTRIEVLHQLHLGPRKSLALVRVAGEAILVGVSDHNINMIKPIALIDDEVEGLLGKDFNNFLEDEFSVQDVRTALNSTV